MGFAETAVHQSGSVGPHPETPQWRCIIVAQIHVWKKYYECLNIGLLTVTPVKDIDNVGSSLKLQQIWLLISLFWPAANGAMRFCGSNPFTIEVNVSHGDCQSYPSEDSSERCKYYIYLSQSTAQIHLHRVLCTNLLLFVFQTIWAWLQGEHRCMRKPYGAL